MIIAGKQEAIGTTTAAMSKAAVTSLFSVVYVTVPSVEVGKKIARDVVGKRLAACVNIVPQLTSVYEWKGQMQEDTESMLIIKTGTDRLPALKEAVLKQHPYEVPEFISLPIEQGSEPYLKWIREQTTGAPVNETKQ